MLRLINFCADAVHREARGEPCLSCRLGIRHRNLQGFRQEFWASASRPFCEGKWCRHWRRLVDILQKHLSAVGQVEVDEFRGALPVAQVLESFVCEAWTHRQTQILQVLTVSAEEQVNT